MCCDVQLERNPITITSFGEQIGRGGSDPASLTKAILGRYADFISVDHNYPKFEDE